jgi:HAD superfamily hydrolase (TIGR01509 family)
LISRQNQTGTPKPSAVVFDMDGVLVDSNPFHLTKWVAFLGERGIPFDRDKLPVQIFGQRNDTVLRRFLGEDLSRTESRRMSEELEARFREVFRPHAKPLPGLWSLIDECVNAGIPLGVASSAMRKNVDFVVDALGIAPSLQAVISGDEISRAKPDPEIYLLAAQRLGVDPAGVVAFEDSFVGIQAVRRAGMKCVAIASTFSVECLKRETEADSVARSFEEMTLERLRQLFDAAGRRLR